MQINHWKIGTRLAAGNAILLALIVAVAMVGLNGMARGSAALSHITHVNVAKLALLEDMASSVHIVSRVIRTMALIDDPAEAQREYVKITAAREKYDAAMSKLETMPLDDAGKATVARLKEHQAAARPLNNKFLELIRTDREAAIKLLRTDGAAANNRWQDELHGFSELQRRKNAQDEAGASQAYTGARMWMFLAMGLALTAGAGLAWVQSRSIVQPLQSAVNVARTVASGDLSAHIATQARDETGDLLRALADMNGKLRDMVTQVRSGAESVATASAQIAGGNHDLSARTEQQAGTLEETAASMEEISSTVAQSLDHALSAQQLAQQAAGEAQQGGAVVAQVIATMSEIDASSRKISDITSVIDGIAFQTNILALNAAVEAARAGEQGRGFAVVAGEVRSLAQRCATAAREIKTLITDSNTRVEEGTRQVHLAGTAIGQVVERVQQVSQVVDDISRASREQNSGIVQINEALTQMDTVTQQNAALVEEAASAAEALQDQATALEKLVRAFNTGRGDATVHPLPRRRDATASAEAGSIAALHYRQ
ncbi:methyl-accepting chemotaxis protein [Pseudoduganella ginsengisoli]|uniref:HAMP domain-containing protein n=1 Tax=Pseudoduganella ginsengisoli TaxID=1462440 RepID=A0A6L6Q609_9BURK|nr:methyl-accepting chemotaxis protein [Pseudoduganella ginsengisoli]MTW04688.1 HAMP domain-containing protein [Pseudoduganella ginsengisoli]